MNLKGKNTVFMHLSILLFIKFFFFFRLVEYKKNIHITLLSVSFVALYQFASVDKK